MNKIDLENRFAVVTGSAQGIGYAVARRMLQSGASVCLWDRDADELQVAKGTLSAEGFAERVATTVVDQTDYKQVLAAADSTLETFGRIDVLVNNAGIAGPNSTVAEYPIEDWLSVINIDLNGVFFCCKAVAPHMANQNYGRIVNVASIAGKEGNPNASAYSSAKAGVIALTKSLGKELAKKNVAVNCVTPAAAKTRIFDQMSETHINYMLEKIPRGRFLQVDEAAAMIAWLCSEDNSFTTSGVFDLSGGRATY